MYHSTTSHNICSLSECLPLYRDSLSLSNYSPTLQESFLSHFIPSFRELWSSMSQEGCTEKKSLKSLAHFEICLAFRVGISFAKAWARHYCFCNDKNSVEWQNHYLQAKCSLDPSNQPASTQVCDDHLEYKTNSDLSCKHTLQHKQNTRPLFIHSTTK